MAPQLKILLVGALAVAIAYASLRDSPYLAELPFIPGWLGKWLDSNQDVRHMTGYGLLAFLVMFALEWNRPVRLRLSVLLGFAVVAAGLEAAQLFLPNRHADYHDVVWSWVGLSIGGGVAWVLGWLLSRKRVREEL